MIKPLGKPYGPNARHWLKLKGDYMDTADTVDLVVLGASYGKGVLARATEAGILSKFLLGSFDTEEKKWKTVVKVGNGLDEATLKKLQKNVMDSFVKISRDPSKLPDWIDCHRQNVPDFIVKDYRM